MYCALSALSIQATPSYPYILKWKLVKTPRKVTQYHKLYICFQNSGGGTFAGEGISLGAPPPPPCMKPCNHNLSIVATIGWETNFGGVSSFQGWIRAFWDTLCPLYNPSPNPLPAVVPTASEYHLQRTRMEQRGRCPGGRGLWSSSSSLDS